MDQDNGLIKAHYDRDRKQISVKTVFVDIEIKLIASPEAWFRAWENLKFDNLTFADVKPFLQKIGGGKNTKKNVQLLLDLAESHNDIFATHFLHCVMEANYKNPKAKKLFKRPRGTHYPGVDTWKAARFAMLLESYLEHMEGAEHWPQYLKNFYEAHIDERKAIECAGKICPSIITWALEKYFGCKFTNEFFRTLIQKKRIKLERNGKPIIVTPESDPLLNQFFNQFK